MTTLDEHTFRLGKFWVNFNALELLIRLYLTKRNNEDESGIDLDEGQTCAQTHLTNFDSFNTLASKYNAAVGGPSRIKTDEIGRFRDAIAHGRSTTVSEAPMTVIKFSRPSAEGKVTVEYRQVLTNDYLDARIRECRDALMSVVAKIKADFPETMP